MTVRITGGMMALRDDLVAAKALIDTPRKWRKDAASDEKSCCAIVAANRVSEKKRDRQYPLWKALCDALPGKPTSSRHGVAVGDFNDHPDTTHADIMALFDRAIASAGDPHP